MQIDILTLPESVKRQLPLSIRTYKRFYTFEELPARIQHILQDYLNLLPDISYNLVFDLKSLISEYSDFKIIDNYIDLILEYFKNYLLVLPGTYPFDPLFGCRLKTHLQTRDTNLRRTLLSAEIDNIIAVLSADFDVSILIRNISITPISMGSYTEFNVVIDLSVNGSNKSMNLQYR